ncbi:hypothetical protein GCM10027091_36520 [Streptomyces daliensis]
MAGAWIGTQPVDGPHPVEPGHHGVQRDDIGPDPLHDVQALDTIGGGHDLEALKLEIDPDQLPDDLAVINHKDPAGHTWHTAKPRPAPPAPSGFCPFPPLPVTGTENEGLMGRVWRAGAPGG